MSNNDSESITPTQRTKNLIEWGTLQFLQPTEESHTSKEERLRSEAKRGFFRAVRKRTNNRYISERVANAEGLTSEKSKLILEKFSADGLTANILEAPPVDRKMYFVGLSIRLHNFTMAQFIDVIYENNPFIEFASAVLGTHDCLIGLYCSESELTNWLWKDLRELESQGAQVVNTTTYSPLSKVRKRFDPRDHPRYLDVSQSRFNHAF